MVNARLAGRAPGLRPASAEGARGRVAMRWREFENLTADIEDQDRELARLRTRLAQAEQGLRGERQSYAELEKRLDGLVREVERPKP